MRDPEYASRASTSRTVVAQCIRHLRPSPAIIRSALGMTTRLTVLLGIVVAMSGLSQSPPSVAWATHTGAMATPTGGTYTTYPGDGHNPYEVVPGPAVTDTANPWGGAPTPTSPAYQPYQPAQNQTQFPGGPVQQNPGYVTPTPYPTSPSQPYPGSPNQPYPGVPGQQSVPSPPYVGAPGTNTGPGAGGAIVPSAASPMPGGADVCHGDEVISFSPETPRIGNELLIAVTSASPHPYGRLAGTEQTTFVRERPGQLGYVWEWTVQPSYPGEHEYTFFVDSTLPCKKITIQVLQSLATRTPTPTKTATPWGWDNGNSNDNNNSNSSDPNYNYGYGNSYYPNPGNTNYGYAPVIDPAGYVMPGQDIYNCDAFQSQSNAQRVLRYDPSDPNRLDSEDGNTDGIACSTYSYSAYPNDRDVSSATNWSATPTPSVFDPRNYLGQGDRYGCRDFGSQANAQAVLRADPNDPNRLDTNPRDGLACGGAEAAQDGVAGGFMPPPHDTTPVPRP